MARFFHFIFRKLKRKCIRDLETAIDKNSKYEKAYVFLGYLAGKDHPVASKYICIAQELFPESDSVRKMTETLGKD